MELKHQKKVFQAMEQPDFYPHPVTCVEKRETHISKVFLTGSYVYKIKKAVNLEFLDFSTLKKRRHFCRRELSLNRRLTNNIYLHVVAITFKEGRYYLEGPGNPVEYAVKMRQLADDFSMPVLLKRSKIDSNAVQDLALRLVEFYNQASFVEYNNDLGSWETIRTNCEENFRLAEKFAGEIFNERKFQIVRAATRSFLVRKKALFLRRMEQGKIRDCHGDLRTEHIYFTDDGIQIIDCIEFNESLRCQDITSDIAFLLMDFDYEGFPQIGRHLLNAYIEQTKDRDAFILLDFYKCYRAFVRCKVNCLRLQEGDLGKYEKSKLLRETAKYLDLAYSYAVQFTRPVLWIVCGMPASGKSTISKELAKVFDIKVYHSDVIRKELFGMQPNDPSVMPFEEGIYSQNATSLTYGKLLFMAQEEIEKGNSVILDATYSISRHRNEALRLARDKDVNIIFAECISPENLLKVRLLKREKALSVSDARLDHFKQFRKRFEPVNEVQDEIHIHVDTANPVNECIQQILSHD